jgi:hypothetical protein
MGVTDLIKRIERLECAVAELRALVELLVGRVGSSDSSTSERRLKGRAVPAQEIAAAAPPKRQALRAHSANDRGLRGAIARGEAARLGWITSGEVVPAKALADRWGLTPQALGAAEKRGEVFSLVVKRRRYFPREFLELERADVAQVVRALEDSTPEEKLVFWKRPHGSLGARTAFELLARREGTTEVERVSSLARTWARDGLRA